MSGLEKLKDKVEFILREVINTRNDDKLLAWTLWLHFYPASFDTERRLTFTNFLDLPSQANIQRIRAKFQNDIKDPKYLPTSERVALQRGLNIERWRKALGYGELFPPEMEVKND